MGTRADFYVGRGPEAEWLGSTAWDGYPDGVFDREGLSDAIADEAEWRRAVADHIAGRKDGTTPEQGWPWPWEDSRTTDYAYALDAGVVYGSNFGYEWFVVADGEPDEGEDEDPGPKVAVFPDMSERRNLTYGRRSGTITIGRTADGSFAIDDSP